MSPGALLAVVRAPGGLGLADGERSWAVAASDVDAAAAALDRLERERSPRWVWWSAAEVLGALQAAGSPPRPARAWDLAAVHRLLEGGHDDGPAAVRAAAAGLDPARAPVPGQLDLGGTPDGGEVAAGAAAAGDGDGPVRPDGHLSPDWVDGAWADSPARAARWAAVALETARLQEQRLRALVVAPAPAGGPRSTGGPSGTAGASGDPVQTAWSESAAAVLAAELAHGGLPLDAAEAARVVEGVVGPRPRDEAEAARQRAARDAPVLAALGVPDGALVRHDGGAGAPGSPVDLRSPAQVRRALHDVGLDLPDTRSWRLEGLAAEDGAHPALGALVAWRRAERFAVAHGYRWLDEAVRDGRLRAAWSASDGGAGRMTASAGLHNLPRELRVAVRAEPGRLLVRADLGQVEPRVLAVVSGDRALARAADADDLYSPVAARLGVAREVAKVAVLAAMYGQTSGAAGATLAAMERAYPVATGFLVDAARRGAAGEDVRTAGGRRVRVPAVEEVPVEAGAAAVDRERAARAARGRYARNAVVQGSAAELFKAWAATVRARLLASGDGEVVLCLHDELLLHVREDAAHDVAAGLARDLEAASARWCRAVARPPVRFTADVAVVERWSQAKG
ncbi:DNA polymerase [uncultured Pseudokineococcus sp.]|uniref:DNA polymerase n=1 Tax=uncultured Pseudokineococcus sp. TaxID=1642928 RepID=UPI00260B2A82|nr:DNA polymerase [uncultured Pseudokineococcus sp.]